MSTGISFFLHSFVCFILSECLHSFSNVLLPLNPAGVLPLPAFPSRAGSGSLAVGPIPADYTYIRPARRADHPPFPLPPGTPGPLQERGQASPTGTAASPAAQGTQRRPVAAPTASSQT